MDVIVTHNVMFKRAPSDFIKSTNIYGFGGRLHNWHLKNVTDNIEKLVAFEDSNGVRSTFFVYVGSKYLDELGDFFKKIIKEGWDVQLLYKPFGELLGSFRLQRDLFEWKVSNIYGVRVIDHPLNEDVIDLLAKEAMSFDSSFRAESVMKYDPVWIREDLVELPISFSFDDMVRKLRTSIETALGYFRAKLDSAIEINSKVFVLDFPQELFYGPGEDAYKKMITEIKGKNLRFRTCTEVIKDFRKTRMKTPQF